MRDPGPDDGDGGERDDRWQVEDGAVDAEAADALVEEHRHAERADGTNDDGATEEVERIAEQSQKRSSSSM